MKTPFICTLILMAIAVSSPVNAQLVDQGGINAPRIQATQIIQQADYVMRFGGHQEAILSYTNAINMDPAYAEAYMKRARAYQLLGETQSAIRDYDMAKQLNPYSEAMFDKRAALRMLAMDFNGALEDQNQALVLNPDDDNIRSHRLDVFIATGQYDKALLELDTLIAHGFELEHEYEKQALVRFQSGDLLGAYESVDKALEVNPYSSIAHDVKGLLLMKQEKYEEAIASFDEAVTFNSEFALAYYNRAVAHKHLGHSDLAMKDLNTSIAISKDIPHVYFARALVKKNMGDLDGAIEDYSAAQMGDSIYAQALYNRSYSYQMMGDQARAMADAQTIVSLNEDDPASWNLKGNVHVLYGEYHQAVEAYEEAIRKDPQFARAYHNRGLAYHMSYRPIQGCADLERAVDLGFIESSNPHKYFCGF